MNKKTFLKMCSVALSLFILISSVGGLNFALPTLQAEAAGPSHKVTGWAFSGLPDRQDSPQGGVYGGSNSTLYYWTASQAIGWISMASTNANSGGGSYGVTLDPVTGKFSGYAWSELGGWVDFAPSATPPSNANTTAQTAFVDPTCLADKTRTCPVKGWIRFVNGASGSSSWDGWVNMEIFTTSTINPAFPNKLGVTLLPEANGVRKFWGYAWGSDIVGLVSFDKAQLELTDVCPDTKFATGDPKYDTGFDPKTVGTQTTMPTGYSVKDGLCGIFGCTDKTAVNYNKNATIDDGSCIPFVPICPDGSDAPNGDINQCPEDPKCTPKSDDYNPFTKTCQTCNPNSKDYDPKTGLCEVCNAKSATYNPVFKDCRECNPSVATYNSTTGLCTTDPLCPDGSVIPPNGICPGGSNDPADQCLNIEKVQTTVPSPYTQVIQAGVKNCFIIGCTDPHANNTTPGATMQSNPSTCTYDPGVEICGNKRDDDGDGLTDEGCPSYPTAPKKPIYIET